MALSEVATYSLLLLSTTILSGCEGMAITDVASLLDPALKRSEVVGFVAGLGTTFAAFPDLFTMLKRRSAEGMNPTMAGIMGVFQILWIYYGLLIGSRPVIVWNLIAVIVNLLSVATYLRFDRRRLTPTRSKTQF